MKISRIGMCRVPGIFSLSKRVKWKDFSKYNILSHEARNYSWQGEDSQYQQSIKTIGLKHEIEDTSRRTQARIHELRETIERLQRGEKVDVTCVLGTGDVFAEKEWLQGKLNKTV